MATRIKAIKCPHCGSSNHRQTDEKRFVCNNCGTEFFLDDDDINININHYNHNSDAPLLSMDSDNAKKLKAALLIFFPVLILFYFQSFPCVANQRQGRQRLYSGARGIFVGTDLCKGRYVYSVLYFRPQLLCRLQQQIEKAAHQRYLLHVS